MLDAIGILYFGYTRIFVDTVSTLSDIAIDFIFYVGGHYFSFENSKVHFPFLGMTLFLCMKAALTEPGLLELCFNFYTATATYLTHMATSDDHSAFAGIDFPLSEDVPAAMACIPEFTADNIIDFMLFLKRFADSVYEVKNTRQIPL